MEASELRELAHTLPITEPTGEPPKDSEPLGELPKELRGLNALFDHCAHQYFAAQAELGTLKFGTPEAKKKALEVVELRKQFAAAMEIRDHDWAEHFGQLGKQVQLVIAKGWQIYAVPDTRGKIPHGLGLGNALILAGAGVPRTR